MALKKYAQGEGELEVFRGEEAVVVNEHVSKTGKTLADFSDEERESLHKDLDSVREVDTSPRDVKAPLEKSAKPDESPEE
jgi:hypothetical protein